MNRLFPASITLLALLYTSACSSPSESQLVVDKAIEAHGGEKFQKAHISFDFRDRHYTYTRRDGEFTYTRAFSDSLGQVEDVLSNTRFYRLIDGDTANLTDERIKAFSNSVNSVIYFAMLPFGLNDPAVKKAYKGETMIDGKQYHLILVSFEEEGGGDDFEDEFLFWINTETNQLDFLAYSYHTEGGGLRFRKAVNPRRVGGILFQDYINYKPKEKGTSLDQLEELYKKGELEELSRIELEDVQVKAL